MILSHTLYTNVNGISDVVDKVRQFAVSVGWTLHEHRTGTVWGGSKSNPPTLCTSSIVAESDAHGAYLCLTSAGQGGTQNLIAKLEVGNYLSSGWETDDYRLLCNMCDSTAYSSPNTINPVLQNSVVISSDVGSLYEKAPHMAGVSMPHDGVIQKLWMYGNDHWICGVALIDGIFCTMFHFGSFEMFDATPTQGEVVGLTLVRDGSISTSGVGAWSVYSNYTPAQFYGAFSTYTAYLGYYCGHYRTCGLNMRYDSRVVKDDIGPYFSDNELKHTLNLNPLCQQNSGFPDNYFNYDESLTKHSANNRKPMAKNVYYSPRQLDEVYEPVCQTPCFFMASTDLDFGQTLDYDGDQYMVFPMVTKSNDWAVAFRIA